MSETLRRTVRICNARGLHARASAKFVKAVALYDAEVHVSRDGSKVDGRSIMGLMMLAAGIGSEIEIEASGPDAAAALDALCQMVADKFDEEQ